MSMKDFYPDWEKLCLPETAEKDLKDFKFTGEGWYIKKEYTVLVVKAEVGINDFYYFYGYDGRSPVLAFHQIASAQIQIVEYQ